MGQKINTLLFRAQRRLSNVSNVSADATNLQTSVWFANKRSYSKLVFQDKAIRDFLKKELAPAGVVEIIVRRYFRKVEVTIFVTKPGVVIGKGGSSINKLREDLVTKFKLPMDLKLDIQEYKEPYRSAKIVAEEISEAIKRGISYRKLIKNYLEKIRYAGVLGTKITVSGRLNGAEIARAENFALGSVPRHTIDSSIDYHNIHCLTKAGMIGIKVWLYKGDKFKNYVGA